MCGQIDEDVFFICSTVLSEGASEHICKECLMTDITEKFLNMNIDEDSLASFTKSCAKLKRIIFLYINILATKMFMLVKKRLQYHEVLFFIKLNSAKIMNTVLLSTLLLTTLTYSGFICVWYSFIY